MLYYESPEEEGRFQVRSAGSVGGHLRAGGTVQVKRPGVDALLAAAKLHYPNDNVFYELDDVGTEENTMELNNVINGARAGDTLQIIFELTAAVEALSLDHEASLRVTATNELRSENEMYDFLSYAESPEFSKDEN